MTGTKKIGPQTSGGFSDSRSPRAVLGEEPRRFLQLGPRPVSSGLSRGNLRLHHAPDEPARHPPSSVYDNPCPWTLHIKQPKYHCSYTSVTHWFVTPENPTLSVYAGMSTRRLTNCGNRVTQS